MSAVFKVHFLNRNISITWELVRNTNPGGCFKSAELANPEGWGGGGVGGGR